MINCSLCNRRLEKTEAVYLECRKFPNEPHGKYCNCELPLGVNCFRKLSKKWREEVKNNG